ncbi:MAG: hypothetical protein ACOC8P_03295 [Dichotomicrobium sp.]
MTRTALTAFAVVAAVVLVASSAQSAELIMVEEKGCPWCARWDAEIAPIYPLTEEGKTAPLRRIDLHGRRPENIAFRRPISFTPTFVLVADGKELGRIEGYPGEDFFWPLLNKLLKKHIELEGDKQ